VAVIAARDSEKQIFGATIMNRRYWYLLGLAGFFWLAFLGQAFAETVSPQADNRIVVPGSATMSTSDVITLPEGLRKVTSESRDVKVSLQDELIADADSRIVRSRLLPTVTASAGYTSLANQPTAIFGALQAPVSDRNYSSFSVNVEQILFDFQANLSRYEASRMQFEAKHFGTVSVRNAVGLGFIVSFYDVLEADQLVEVAKREIERLESHLKDAQGLFNVSLITKNDLLQAQVRLSDARQRFLATKNLRAIRASRLNNILLRPLSAQVNVQEEPRELVAPDASSLEKSWGMALEKRPEIQIVDKTLASIDLEMASKKAEFLPKVFAGGSYAYQQNSYQLYQDNWAVIVGVNISLFEGGRTLADLQKSQQKKVQLIEQRDKLVDEIKLQVQQATLNMQDAYERIQVARDTVEQAQENLRINKKRYEVSVGTATEVLDAVTLLTVSETNHIRSIYDYRKAEAANYYATGTDLLAVYR
jgi:outer membrane protein